MIVFDLVKNFTRGEQISISESDNPLCKDPIYEGKMGNIPLIILEKEIVSLITIRNDIVYVKVTHRTGDRNLADIYD